MTATIKLTSKRQATFPADLCRELGIKPGDELVVERRLIDGQTGWLLAHPKPAATPWFGSLKAYAKGKSYDLEAIRASIAKRRGADL